MNVRKNIELILIRSEKGVPNVMQLKVLQIILFTLSEWKKASLNKAHHKNATITIYPGFLTV